MKLIIDIDKDIAQGIIDGKGETPRNIVRSFQATIADAIKNSTPLEEELKKIKAEVIELSYNCEIATVDRYRVEKLIDNLIAELKGSG